jgi:aspartate/methionine/tyrosine aminotransferase
MPSSASDFARELPDFRLEVFLGRWEFAARHHLTASDAQTLTIRELLDLADPTAREKFEQLTLGYTPTWGTDELREAIASTYDTVEPKDVLTFAGAEEAMFWALQELVGPGDHAVVTVPNYQSMESVTLATGAEVEALQLRPEDGWAPDLDALESLVKPNTRLIAINFPNNPTGAVPDRATFTTIVELCDERDIRLFSDEVYRGLELDQATTLPQAADLSDSAISLNVMSKAYGLPGLRIGWLACRDRALLERLEKRKHYTSICNAAPSEQLAAIALKAGDQIKARNRGIIASNLPVFDEFFARFEHVFEWSHPQGGCVCFPRLTTGEPTASFCERLVQSAGVVLLGGDIYHSELAEVPADRFRIGVGRRDPEPGLEALARFLEAEAL